ncbi:MAG: zinc ribbon domain-containing protein [bacterium]|nr:FmdB family transcriptional regulator [Deltaproteobacteria bacterium]MCP4903623.1 zinc ribbon domain-containing protein [bacterium]
MPTYDYQCQKCGFEFERDQRITEDPIKTCPECKSRQARRLLSAPSFILKGGGWYADGYGSNGAPKADDKSSGDDSSSPESSSESKSSESKSSSAKSDGAKKAKSSSKGSGKSAA